MINGMEKEKKIMKMGNYNSEENIKMVWGFEK